MKRDGLNTRGKFGEHSESFIVKDANGQALAYVYFADEPGRRPSYSPATWPAAWPRTSPLPELLRRND